MTGQKFIPSSWTTWGTFPKSSDKDLYTYNIIWRAFSPDETYIIELKWVPEQDPKGSMVCRLILNKDWTNPLQETKPAKVGALVLAIQKIMSNLPPKPEKVNKAGDPLLSVKTKRKYTKKAARWFDNSKTKK